jgi:hypothetical protein
MDGPNLLQLVEGKAVGTPVNIAHARQSDSRSEFRHRHYS